MRITLDRGWYSAPSRPAPVNLRRVTHLSALVHTYAMIRRRAAAAGIATKLGNHSFRATGITAYLKNGGTLEKAAAMRTMPRHARRNFTIAGATNSASMRSSGS
jgi:hypothetical protein